MTTDDEQLTTWMSLLAKKLDLTPGEIDHDLLLDLTREVAHGVTRPAGPLTTYLLGIAVAQGADLAAAVDVVRDTIAESDIAD